MAWEERAVCRGADTSLFFAPDTDAPSAGMRYTQARRWCRVCPVRRQCLDTAMRREGNLTRNARGGMWGGMSPGEREALHLSRRTAGASR